MLGCYHYATGEIQLDEMIFLLKKYANKGNAKAQFHLGIMYFMGQGVVQNYKTAVNWFKLAADQGHTEAQFYLGFNNRYGLENRELKIKVFEKISLECIYSLRRQTYLDGKAERYFKAYQGR
tara:strand:+ start:321 stop:686 length:366 start_codon:yes stop_codon:yes gene_type:complete